MFSTLPIRTSVVHQQVRHASNGRKKTRLTSERSNLRNFFGPRNFKGMYTKNPFFWSGTGPKYISSYDRKRATSSWQSVFDKQPFLKESPFPENKFCKSNQLISTVVKKSILRDHSKTKLPVQKIGFKYGISIPRIEAIITLNKIERETKMPPAVGKMARVMERMFPTMRGKTANDDMTEIPIPRETRHQRFLSVAESEPFGPVDAAAVLNIEPASQTLEKLNNHELENQNTKKNAEVAFIAQRLEGEKAVFKFTNVSVGKVGYRYGASKDDRKHARKVRYTALGQRVYA